MKKYTMSQALSKARPPGIEEPFESLLAAAYPRMRYDKRNFKALPLGAAPTPKAESTLSHARHLRTKEYVPADVAAVGTATTSSLEELANPPIREDLGDGKYGRAGRLSAWCARGAAGTPELKNDWLMKTKVGHRARGWRA